MNWTAAKAAAAETLAGLRSRFPDPDVRLILRALMREFQTTKMKFTTPLIELAGRRYTFVERHAAADALLAEAGIAIPKIPPGCNTVIARVHLRGLPALAINQTGFQGGTADNEQEVNGCALLILLDPTGEDAIDFGLLEQARATMTK